MTSQAKAKSICDRVLRLAGSRGVEIILTAEESALTRFANNAIHQNVTSTNLNLSLRAILGKRTARADTNALDDESLAQTLDRAFELARVQQPDPDLLPLPAHQTYRRTRSYLERTARFSPADRAKGVSDAVAVCKKRGASAAGAFATGASLIAIANSRVLFACNRASMASFSITAQMDDVSGWAEQISVNVSKIDAKSAAEKAAATAKAAARPKALAPGAYEVILEPAAVADLLLFLGFYGGTFNAMAHLEKRSPFAGMLGKKVLGGNFSLTEDPYHRLLPGQPFDMEGIPTKRVELIRNGVLNSLVHDRATAKKMKTRTTGHAAPQPAPAGPDVSGLVMKPGDSTVGDMIAATKRGILVTHLHYTNMVEVSSLTVTGMTRDGTFLVEGGKIRHAVRNMRFTQSLRRAFSNILDVGSEQVLCHGFFGGGVVAAAMRIKDFNFSSETEF